MLAMAERESGVTFMSEMPKSHNGQMPDIDSTSDTDSEDFSMTVSAGETKRNKRKNFQPRNIAHPGTEPMEASDESDYALDLSNAEKIVSPVKAEESTPIDLSCSKSAYSYDYVNSCYSGSDSDEKEDEDRRRKQFFESFRPPPAYLLHPFLGQPGDASDMKEYAQNTVKELLEIYGLNSDAVTDVAQTITNNIPISNFSSGNILDTLSVSLTGNTAAAAALLLKNHISPKSEPPTPPRSPHSPSSNKNLQAPPPTMKTQCDLPVSNNNQSIPKVPPLFSSANIMLPQNMAAILAVASMKEQLKLENNNAADMKPSVTITPSRPSPNPPNENSNPDTLTIRRVSISPPMHKDSKPLQQSQSAATGNPIDYSRYVKRFGSSAECGNSYCKDLNYREHFHCLDCNSRVFIKKEEMIRHFKWHKKRDESLQHGFMRYSPSDDCSDRYQNCSHNRKQTHYHCIQGTCDKVYISTSDVQMHANYHRKDSAIIQEGFQRLRATEECRTPYCAFFGQRTTHFHCRREHCQFTFKNKADMEKHKTYHIKDEQLARDGFKKFLKPDPCGFIGCRFSQVCNHIHCVRDGCSYVLHSSGQLLSHKRKHERKDTEIAYRKFKLSQQNLNIFNGEQLSHFPEKLLSPNHSLQLFQPNQVAMGASYATLHENSYSNSSSEDPASPSNSIKFRSNNSAVLPTGGYFTENFSPMDFCTSEDNAEYTHRYISHFQAIDTCFQGNKCIMYGTDHYHCKEANCELCFKTREVAETHAKLHEAQERLSENLYQEGTSFCQENSCPREKHFHCTWEGCYEVILPHERLDHLRTHEISSNHFNSLDALFRRKRGRPPKNRVIEVWNDYSAVSGIDTPQAIFTSFKLPKPSSSTYTSNSQHSDNEVSSPPSSRTQSPKHVSQHILDQYKFEEYVDGCPDPLCIYSPISSSSMQHFHCKRPRCFFATNMEDQLLSHAVDFHENVEIMDGFLFFDSSVDCRLDNCQSNKTNRHFHCIRPGCGFSFVRYSVMLEHHNKHQMFEPASKNNSKDEEVEIKCEPPIISSPNDSNNSTLNTSLSVSTLSPELIASKTITNVVKASGTFYPLCGINNNVRSTSPVSNSEEKPKSESPQQETSPPPITNSSHSPLLNLLPEWLQVDTHVKFTPEKPCCRAFCKLKRKDHYHCNACNQAFSEIDKLKQHVVKHNTTMGPFIKQENNNNIEDSEDIRHSPIITTTQTHGMDTSSPEIVHSPHHYPPGFGVAMVAAQQLAMMSSQGISFMTPGMPSLYSTQSSLMFTPPHGFPHPHSLIGNGMLDSFSPLSSNLSQETHNELSTRRSPSPHEMSPEMKKARIQSSMRILKDEPVPEGYLRFRFNEDCHYTHCGYREHQTHFHCIRQDCGYSFCDKTRFVQHTARHERLDTLMGGDFQQYRANVSCGRGDCVYTATLGNSQNKASHFHCLKCEFVCTDTNKVVAHRRQHQKLDSIMAAGFEKFTLSQSCSQADNCVHSGKQTHYHCLSCQYAVLGLSQMTAHKYRHLE